MAHRIVWSSVATVDRSGRPRSRVLHPFWQWDGASIVGWISTEATPIKWAHLAHSPYVSCSYWTPQHDSAVAECRASWVPDQETRTMVWNLFKEAPEPLGYDPAAIGMEGWQEPTSEAFSVLRLDPWRLRTLPGELFVSGRFHEQLIWQQ